MNPFPALLLAVLPLQESTVSLVETAPVETTLGSDAIPEAHEVWLEMIGGAKATLDAGFFYLSNQEGSRLEPVIQAMQAAAGRGVRVRVLGDIKFQETYPETLARLDAVAGIEVRLYDIREKTGGVLHAKYMLVDGRDVFLGSQNFDWRSLEHIQELGLRVRDEHVAHTFERVFQYDWRLAGGEGPVVASVLTTAHPIPARFGGERVGLIPVASPKSLLPVGVEWDLPYLVRLIDEAQSSVCVQLLSYRSVSWGGDFFPDLENALRAAANRGVRVRLLLADWNKRKGTIEGLQSLQVMPNLEVRLVTLPEAESGFIPFARVIHSKYLVVDGQRSWVGTSNWSRDYFEGSRNVGLIVEGAALGAELDAYFQRGWDSPYAYDLDPCREYEPPRVQ